MFADKANYRFRRLIQNHSVQNETKQVLTDIEVYFDKFPERESFTWAEFSQWFLVVQHPMYGEDLVAKYRAYFSGMAEDLNEDVVQDIVDSFLKRSFCTEVADIADEVATGSEEYGVEDVLALVDEYQQGLAALDEDLDEWDMESLLTSTIGDGGYTWPLHELNQSLGPVRQGDLILIGARPNAGKTSLIAHCLTHMASQIEDDRPILWHCNEEMGKRVRLRVIQAALGWTTDEIKSNWETAMEQYCAAVNGKHRIIIWHQPDASIYDLEQKCMKLNPAIIVSDQLRKVGGFEGAGTDVQRLAKLFAKARVMAAKYAPFFCVHQLDATAEGVLYPGPETLHGSKTDIQGDLDVQLLIGKDTSPGMEHVRGLSIVKNKLSGGPDTVEALRETTHEVRFHPGIARYEGRSV